MGTSPSCDRLRREHDLIATVLDAVQGLLDGREGATVPNAPVSGAVQFFSTFVQGCHCAKEDEGLLPVLAPYGVGNGDQASLEHDQTRRLLAQLQPTEGEPDDRYIAVLNAYAALLRHHIDDETAHLLPFAERVLSEEDERRVGRAFDRIESATLGKSGQALMPAVAQAVAHSCRAAGGPPAASGPARTARDVMRPRPRHVSPDDSLAKARELMTSLRTRELPVVAGETLVGIVTRTDMEPYHGHYEWTPVRTAMTAPPVTVEPDTPIDAVAALLLDRGFNGVPVSTRGTLEGMIARRDVLRLLARRSS